MFPRSETGFTLIELLVALAVFSLAALALLNVSGESIRTTRAIETRVLAAVVAENRAVEALIAAAPPPLGLSQGQEAAGSRVWDWKRLVTPTEQPGLYRIDITVAEDGRTATVAETILFRSAR